MAKTHFCCRLGGSNLNAGTVDGSAAETATAPLATYTGGDWDASTDVYTAPVGADMTEAVVGRFASLYNDGNFNPGTNQHLVARITAVNAGTRQITLSTTARTLFGTEVTTATGARSMRIGGAWQGPQGTNNWPFNFIDVNLTNAAGDTPQVNLRADAGSFLMTGGITRSLGAVKFRGYTAAYEDGGKATIKGPTAGASFVLLTLGSQGGNEFEDLIFRDNGATGSASGVVVGVAGISFVNCVATGMRGSGFDLQQVVCHLTGCEAYGNNLSNTANKAGFDWTNVGVHMRNCTAHHNTGSNSAGFRAGSSGYTLDDCVSYANGGHGFFGSNEVGGRIVNSAFKDNGGDGLRLDNSVNSVYLIENCVIDNNTGRTINGTGGGGRLGKVRNCAVRAGAGGGATGLKGMEESGTVTLTEDPFAAASAGDFALNDAAGGGALCAGAGHASFTHTQTGFTTPTVSTPSIGPTEAASGGGGGGGGGGGARGSFGLGL